MAHTVRITYCTQCRWLPRAAWLAQELLGTFEAELAEVALAPGRGGVFTVSVNGETVWDRAKDGFPDPAAVKRLVRDRVAPGRALGHADRGGQDGPSAS
ncbi:SelT/SelW/SelH family protein [Streptomyces sp. 7-21]|jgi:selenoprotein W-related protein|uniref:SelT/SelW/SelH family protein n=1 Tax=Streptomyces sp. 7-21 TaxID=2802283 RepID=UPI00191E23F5|nr:SelT/SelW/SelH family protein [Streptomyces sp. 7-21]MBL1067459.1 SelT/SelW/SelH family protein [Streptomyces sp. 7-21]